MKAYTITDGKVKEGIPLHQEGAIVVGQYGRGRTATRVPIPAGAVVEGERLISIADKEGFVAVIFIADHSGFRGTWKLVTHDDKDLDPKTLGVLIAEGYCAQGQAGRMGGGPEYLLVCRPCEFYIRREGRLYGKPELIHVTVTLSGVIAVDAEAEAREAAALKAWELDENKNEGGKT